MNFIVTGGCGFIGSHLVEALVVTGNNVIVVDDQRAGKFKIKDDLFVNEGFKGFGGSPYILINWIPRKTQRKDHVNSVFQEIVQRSHYNEHYFRPKVRKRL